MIFSVVPWHQIKPAFPTWYVKLRPSWLWCSVTSNKTGFSNSWSWCWVSWSWCRSVTSNKTGFSNSLFSEIVQTLYTSSVTSNKTGFSNSGRWDKTLKPAVPWHQIKPAFPTWRFVGEDGSINLVPWHQIKPAFPTWFPLWVKMFIGMFRDIK